MAVLPEIPLTRDERLAFLRVVAGMIGADHKLTKKERKEMDGLILQMGLSPGEEDVRAVIDGEFKKPTPLEKLLEPIRDRNMRRTLYRVLVEVAVSDGLAAKEEQRLVKTAELFQLDAKAAKDVIGWTVESLAMEEREAVIMKRL